MKQPAHFARPKLNQSDFIEKLGRLAEAEGLSRIGGRMIGLLMTAGEPLSIAELAKRLKVSRASISTNGKLLQSLDVIERVTRPGDRQDYLGMSDRCHALVVLGLRRLRAMRELVSAMRHIAGSKRSPSRARIRRIERLYDAVIEGLQAELAPTARSRRS